MQRNILILDAIDAALDGDTVWHDFCTQCAGDANHGESHCDTCGSF